MLSLRFDLGSLLFFSNSRILSIFRPLLRCRVTFFFLYMLYIFTQFRLSLINISCFFLFGHWNVINFTKANTFNTYTTIKYVSGWGLTAVTRERDYIGIFVKHWITRMFSGPSYSQIHSQAQSNRLSCSGYYILTGYKLTMFTKKSRRTFLAATRARSL